MLGRLRSRRFVASAAAVVTAVAGAAAVSHVHAARQGHALAAEPSKGTQTLYPYPPTREQTLKTIKSGITYDVVVIGGGASGVSIALDAASRGLRVALVEAQDFSSGTSSRSTKLLHGGLRYLKIGVFNRDIEQVKVVSEAIKERNHFLAQAPHLSTQIPLMLPVYNTAAMLFYWVGIQVYDWFAGSGNIKPSYMLGRNAVLEKFPTLRRGRLAGAVVYYDGQQNDSRMNVALALTAAASGADLVNHVRVTGLIKSSRPDLGRDVCTGVHVQDALTGEQWDIAAKAVINAAGPFVDEIRAIDDPKSPHWHNTSSGVHLVFPPNYCPPDMGLIQFIDDERVIFVLPWQNRVVVGTTDRAMAPTERPAPSQEEVHEIVHELSAVLEPSTVHASDILSAWTGFRPLLAKAAKSTASVPRGHQIKASDSLMVNVLGGKWTTCRAIAQDAVDFAIDLHKLQPKISKDCQTETITVFGSQAYTPNDTAQLAKRHGLPQQIANHLVEAYGDRVDDVLALVPTATLGSQQSSESKWESEKVVPNFPYLKCEVVYSIRHEWAQTLEDVIARRFRLAFLDTQAAEAAIPSLANIMAKELNWSNARKTAEISNANAFLSTMRP